MRSGFYLLHLLSLFFKLTPQRSLHWMNASVLSNEHSALSYWVRKCIQSELNSRRETVTDSSNLPPALYSQFMSATDLDDASLGFMFELAVSKLQPQVYFSEPAKIFRELIDQLPSLPFDLAVVSDVRDSAGESLHDRPLYAISNTPREDIDHNALKQLDLGTRWVEFQSDLDWYALVLARIVIEAEPVNVFLSRTPANVLTFDRYGRQMSAHSQIHWI